MRVVASLALVVAWSATAGAEAAPAPAQGTLLIHGGGKLPRVVMHEFRALVGRDGTLVVIPTAARGEIDADAVVARWQARGFARVEVVHTRSRATANDPAFVEPLTRATAVWLDGGEQTRLERAYLGTRVETELHALLARGGVIGGTSAGAAILSRVMIRYGNPRPLIGIGFGLVTGAIIDQHFVIRARRARLATALRRHPELVGLGIDEGTALIVRGDQASVIGTSTVTVCLSGSRGKPARSVVMTAGETIDLEALRAEAAARVQARQRRPRR